MMNSALVYELQKTIYKLSEDAFYPNHLGVMYENHIPDEYNIYDFCDAPKLVSALPDIYSGDTYHTYEVIDFSPDATGSGIRFNKLKNDADSIAYLFFALECSEDQDVLFLPFLAQTERIWVNGRVATIYCYCTKSCITLRLKRGMNYICFEQPSPNENLNLSLRIRSLKGELKDRCSLITDNLMYKPGDMRVSFYTNIFPGGKGVFEFSLIPFDTASILNGAKVSIYLADFYTDNRVWLMDCCFGEKYQIDVEKLYCNKEDYPFNSAFLEYCYRATDNTVRKYYTEIRTDPPIKGAELLLEKTKEILLERTLSDKGTPVVEYFYNRLKSSDFTSYGIFYICRMLEYATKNYNEFDGYFNWKWGQEVFYKSDIDGSVRSYLIHLPKSYDKYKEYPLLIIIPADDVSETPHRLNYDLIDLDFICAEIDCRGSNLGSYVGEAALNEVREDIINRFSIDNRRIYLTGQCNGASASLAQISIFPHLYAGAMPCGGMIRVELVQNILQGTVSYVTSNEDNSYDQNQRDFNCAHISLKNIFVADKITHPHLEMIQYQKTALLDLLESRLNRFPRKFKYFTDSNRHLKAHWIQIHSIDEFGDSAKIEVAANERSINIQAENISGLTVNFPDFIEQDAFTLDINSQTFICYRSDKTASFVCKNQHFKHVDVDSIRTPYLFRGYGIVDVYLKPLVVVSCDTDCPAINTVAHSLSHPITNTYARSIKVEYPIISMNDVQHEIHGGLIVIDDNINENPYIYELRKKCFIKTTNQGFSYRSTEYRGDYCVMQITDNPWDKESSVLFVNFNNIDLLKKCFFTRNMILSTYQFGKNLYLNSEALIYFNHKYWIVQRRGDKFLRHRNQI